MERLEHAEARIMTLIRTLQQERDRFQAVQRHFQNLKNERGSVERRFTDSLGKLKQLVADNMVVTTLKPVIQQFKDHKANLDSSLEDENC